MLESGRYTIEVACPRGSELWDWLDDRPDIERHSVGILRRPTPTDASSVARLLPLVRRADIVHAHAAKAGFLARLAARVAGRTQSCLFTPHGWSFWAFDGVHREAYVSLERRAARWCRSIVAVSAFERESGLALGIGNPEQYTVVTNGVELSRFELRHAPIDGRVVMVARLVAQKDPVVAVRAMATLCAMRSQAELLIVGEGPLRPRVERAISDLGVQHRVRLLGQRSDIPELLSGTSCFVLTTRYEGCSLAVVEAMAAGVPVVATRVGGMAELVDHGVNGFLVDNDPCAIANAVDTILGDPSLARRMGDAGRAVARQRLSRQRMVAETEVLYREITGGLTVGSVRDQRA